MKANGRKDVLLIDKTEQSGITLWVDDRKTVSAGQYRDEQAARCASEIAHLLNGAVNGVTGFGKATASGPCTPTTLPSWYAIAPKPKPSAMR